jgi:DnaK suppressor protein
MGTQVGKKNSKGPRKSLATTASDEHSTHRNTTSLESMMHYKFEPYQSLKDEEYMSEQQLKHFRHILETWKQELMKEVDNTISEMKGASVLADPNDRATQEEAFSLELRTRDRERKLIRKIEEALQQIDDREYGYCESCGIEIGIRRLEARPTAVLCIDCKTLDEIRERNTQ